MTTRDVLLAGTIFTSMAILSAPSSLADRLIVAQAPQQQQQDADTPRRPGQRGQQDKEKKQDQDKKQTPAQPQRPGARERQPAPAAQERQQQQQQRPAAQERSTPQTPSVQGQPDRPQPPTARERREPQTPAARRPGQQPSPTAQERRDTPPAAEKPGQPPAPIATDRPGQQPPPAAGRQPSPPTPAAQDRRGPGQQGPATATPPSSPPPPAAQGRPPQPPAPTASERPAQPPATATQPSAAPPAAQGQPPATQQPATAQDRRPAAVEPPREQARDAREFLRRDGQQDGRRIEQVRQERREVREGNRVFIKEPDRTIIREGNRTIIRHNEADRFTIGARDVRVERRGGETFSIVERPGGVRIITVVDEDGRLLRRIRRDTNGREVVIIDNGRRRGDNYVVFVQLPPPVIRIPRERYIVELERADRNAVYAALTASPVERLERRYTLDEVRYSPELRDRMPRVDIDTVNFDSGSWQLAPDQLDRLAPIADGMKLAIERNQQELFQIEGYTDAVGADIDNLSLSDRRAEAVAVALTEQFGVPAENLTTQGYGEQYLKVPTQGPERLNRRVSVRRLTPLIDQQLSGDTSGAR
jgi:outer membrane protein OmpA-like peptidoglycan-associated protein